MRTNFPMRPQCGIYYYEIRVLKRGQDALIAVGFCRYNKLDKLPGCEQHSYGYHGQSGQLFKQGHANPFGPTFTSPDIIGCGLNFATNSAFFTKNGVLLGVAEDIDTSELLYPCIGLSTNGEKITANFGQEPFAFDIDQFVKEQQAISIQSIHTEKQQAPNEKYKVDSKADMDQLVLSYLLYQGYTQTAKSLLNNIEHVKQKTYTDQFKCGTDENNRTAIRKLILAGSVDSAIEQTRTMYPGLLEENDDLLFQLKTRKFLDILIDGTFAPCYSSDTDDDTSSSYSGRSRALSVSSSFHELQNQVLYEEKEQTQIPVKSTTLNLIATPLAPLPVAASGRRLSWAAIAASPTSTIDTCAVEDMFIATGGKRKSITAKRRDSHSSIDDSHEEDMKKLSVIRKAMSYGHELQEEYGLQPRYLSKLNELFAILSFSDPKSCPSAHLLEPSLRDTTASELNSAIKIYQGCSKHSKLESIYKQSMLTTNELVISGHGKASLLHVQEYFMGV
ncbi:uncharacterized protein EV154DRAFT_489381 [Mucor mucedo]|uniref:uncharacterized protein n=1 Tax=Mucor mucedo TaxID=29922 RepID=UPI0022203C6B|nr:uncharacterized protein EV154DRAFT_489381 [Mucor mucedo]KAI7897225.1 hypothetical protein EV154DRAFT_489381 [Mucor mucedo]